MKRDTSTARAAAAAARARRAEGGAAPTATRSRLWLLILAVGGGLLLLLLISSASPSLTASQRGLQPWSSKRWRYRPGQFIDPAAAESLEQVAVDTMPCLAMTLDISREGGGPYGRHLSHQTGRDVDIRMTDLPPSCRTSLQQALKAHGWRVWYDGPDSLAPMVGGRHISHLHARYQG